MQKIRLNKKVLGMMVIATSVALAGCSDDDDGDGAQADTTVPVDDTFTPTTGTETEGDPGTDDVTETELPESPAATPGEGSTALDFIVNSENHTQLEMLVSVYPEILNGLDDPNLEFTVFAPTDAAFEALDQATKDFLADEANADAVERILRHHGVVGSVQSMAVIDGVAAATEEVPFSVSTLADAAPAQSLSFTANEEGTGYDITDGMGNTVALTGPLDQNAPTEVGAETTGIVHVIDSILMPVAAEPEAEGETDLGATDEGAASGGGGAADLVLAEAGVFSIVRQALDNNFPDQLNTEAWTAFLPSDSVLSAAAVTELTGAQLQDHIVSSNVIDPDSLAGLETVTSSSGKSYAVTTTDGETSVAGFSVVPLATLPGGAQIYQINGVLQ